MDEPSADVRREIEQAAQDDDTEPGTDEESERPPEGMPSLLDRIVGEGAKEYTSPEDDADPSTGHGSGGARQG